MSERVRLSMPHDYYERGGKGRWRLSMISSCDPPVVVVLYYMIIMKEVERGGGVLIPFYEPVVVVE